MPKAEGFSSQTAILAGIETPLLTDKSHHSRLTAAFARRRLRGRAEWIAVIAFGLFGFFRFWQALRSPQGVWEDSLSYEAVGRLPLLSSAFWAGTRPPLAPLLWKITGTPTSFVVVQTSLAVLAWGFLAFTVGGLVPRGWRRVLAITVVLAFACTMPVSEWDWSVLSESLALSSLAAIFAFSIRFVRTARFAGLLCAATAFVLARDEDIWTVALIGIATLCIAVAMLVSLHRKRAHQLSDAPASGIGTAALRNVGAAEGLAGTTSLVNVERPEECPEGTGPEGTGPEGTGLRRRQFAEASAALGTILILLALVVEIPAVTSQRDVANIVDNLIVRIFPFPDRVAWFAAHGMPESARVDQLGAAAPAVPASAVTVSPDLELSEFSALNSWIQTNGASVYFLWLLEHPGFVLTAPFSTHPLTFNDASGDIGFYAPPGRLPTSFLDRILFPTWWGEGVTFIIALTLAWWRFGSTLPRRRNRRRNRRRDRRRDSRDLRSPHSSTSVTPTLHRQVWAVVILGAIGPIAMLLAWQGDGQEVTRHMVEGSVEMRLGILLVLVIAALGGRGADVAASTALPGAAGGAADGSPDGSPAATIAATIADSKLEGAPDAVLVLAGADADADADASPGPGASLDRDASPSAADLDQGVR